MTYQELKDRLSKCEYTLTCIKDGSSKIKDTKTVRKLELLKESLKTQLKEMDVNDPVMMKLRALKAKIGRKKGSSKSGSEKGLNPRRRAVLIKKLMLKRDQVMRDMEQEAEPEGGPIADKYGDMLNKIDAALKKAKGTNPKSYNDTFKEGWNDRNDVFSLGYDLDATQYLIDYLKSKYKEGVDYKLHIGRGDTHPNAITLINPEMEQDKELGNLLMAAGDNEETDYQSGREAENDYTDDKSFDETKEAPAGHYFTKSGNLVKGTMSADAKERGARKSDPKDKTRSKVPKATQYNEEEMESDPRYPGMKRFKRSKGENSSNLSWEDFQKKFPQVKDDNLAGEVYSIMQEQDAFNSMDYDDEDIISFMNAASTWTDADAVADYFDEPASDIGKLIAGYYQEESGYEGFNDKWDNYLDYLFPQTERRGNDIDDYRIKEAYKPGSIAPKDLYYSDKHSKLVAMDDVDSKYHDRLELVYKKGDKIEGPMEGLWANINAKRKAGKKPSHGNSKAHKDAVKAGNKLKEDVSPRFIKKYLSLLPPDDDYKNNDEYLVKYGEIKDIESYSDRDKAILIFLDDQHGITLSDKLAKGIKDKSPADIIKYFKDRDYEYISYSIMSKQLGVPVVTTMTWDEAGSNGYDSWFYDTKTLTKLNKVFRTKYPELDIPRFNKLYKNYDIRKEVAVELDDYYRGEARKQKGIDLEVPYEEYADMYVQALKDKNALDKSLKEQDRAHKLSKNEISLIAHEAGKAVISAILKSGDEIRSAKIKDIYASALSGNSPEAFTVHIIYKNDKEDGYRFQIQDDKLYFLAPNNKNIIISDVGIKPSGEAVINKELIKNEMLKYFNNLNELENKGMVVTKDSDEAEKLAKKGVNVKLTTEGPHQTTYIKIAQRDYKKAMAIIDRAIDSEYVTTDIVDDDGDGNVIVYFNFTPATTDHDHYNPDTDPAEFIYDLSMDLQSRDVQVVAASHDLDETMTDKEFTNAQEHDRLQNHPERDKILAIQQLIAKEKKLKEDKYDDMVATDKDIPLDKKKGAAKALRMVDKGASFDKVRKHISEESELDKITKAMRLVKKQAPAMNKLDKDDPKRKAFIKNVVRLNMKAKELIDKEDGRVSNIGKGQELDEGRGDFDDVLKAVENMANNDDISERDAAAEIVLALADKFQLPVDKNLEDYMEESVNESTDLYDRNGILITRFAGGEKRGLMVQINYGLKYIQVPADEYNNLVRAMASVRDDIRDMKLQQPADRYEGVDEAEAKPIPDTILRGYNANVKNAQSMASALLSLFDQINDNEPTDFKANGNIKRVLKLLNYVAKTPDTETDQGGEQTADGLDEASNSIRTPAYDQAREQFFDYLEKTLDATYRNASKGATAKKLLIPQNEEFITQDILPAILKRDDQPFPAIFKQQMLGDENLRRDFVRVAIEMYPEPKITPDAVNPDGSEYMGEEEDIAHDCANHVLHEKYGHGICLEEQHTLVKEGNKHVVTHYDVFFKEGSKTVRGIPVSELKVITESHHGHKRRKK